MFPAVEQRRQVVVPAAGVATGEHAEVLEVLGEPLVVGVDHGVRTEGRDHAATESVGGEALVMAEFAQRRIGGGDDLDAESVEQRARAERIIGETLGDLVIGLVCGRAVEPDAHTEHVAERVIEPQPRRSSPEQVHVAGEGPPCVARSGHVANSVGRPDAERLERHALAVEHPHEVVVGRDEQVGRIGEGFVVGEPSWIGVAVRAQQGKVGDLVVQLASDVALDRVGGEEPVGMEREWRAHDDVVHRSRRSRAAAFGVRSRVKTPFLFPPTRMNELVVSKSAKFQTCSPTTASMRSKTRWYVSRNSTWYSSLHGTARSEWSPGSCPHRIR